MIGIGGKLVRISGRAKNDLAELDTDELAPTAKR